MPTTLRQVNFITAGSLTYGGGGAPDNFAGWMMTWNYTNIRSSGVSSVQREAEQHLGRPWTRMCPTIGVIKNTFADKTNDSRYDGTFTTVYRGNWPKGGITSASLVNANGLSVVPGDAILTFLNDDDPTVVYATANGGIGAGVLPGRADFVISPNAISRVVYPGLWKLGPYRTDNGTGLGQPNAGSYPSFQYCQIFGALLYCCRSSCERCNYTVAGKSARELINVIRARAGKWRWDNNGNIAKVADNSAAMTAATPATIDINYILGRTFA